MSSVFELGLLALSVQWVGPTGLWPFVTVYFREFPDLCSTGKYKKIEV